MRIAILTLILALTAPTAILAKETPVNQVKVHTETGVEISSFSPFEKSYGDFSLAVSDFGSDGVDELVFGSPAGLSGEVILTDLHGNRLNSFLPYGEDFKHGVLVAACDLEGDGDKEIITGTNMGATPLVKIFSSYGIFENQFYAYDKNFKGGVQVACGDINNDGKSEILTGPGIGGGPHLKIFNSNLDLIHQSFPLMQPDVGGLTVQIERENIYLRRLLDDNDRVIISKYDDKNNTLQILSSIEASGVLSISSFAYSNGETRKLISRVIDDKHSEVAVFENDEEISSFKPFSRGFSKTISANSENGPVQVSVQTSDIDRKKFGQYILVDLSEQHLWAYENGGLVMNFPISSGRPGSSTPLGITTVTDKLPTHDYKWFGGGRLTYFIPDVKWNLRFRKHYYIHSATWHNNFGHPMSAGCINVEQSNAKKIYDWAEVGAKVEISE